MSSDLLVVKNYSNTKQEWEKNRLRVKKMVCPAFVLFDKNGFNSVSGHVYLFIFKLVPRSNLQFKREVKLLLDLFYIQQNADHFTKQPDLFVRFCVFIHLPTHPTTHTSTHTPTNPYAYWSIHPPSLCQSIYLLFLYHPFIYLPFIYPFIHLSTIKPTYLSIYPSIQALTHLPPTPFIHTTIHPATEGLKCNTGPWVCSLTCTQLLTRLRHRLGCNQVPHTHVSDPSEVHLGQRNLYGKCFWFSKNKWISIFSD